MIVRKNSSINSFLIMIVSLLLVLMMILGWVECSLLLGLVISRRLLVLMDFSPFSTSATSVSFDEHGSLFMLLLLLLLLRSFSSLWSDLSWIFFFLIIIIIVYSFFLIFHAKSSMYVFDLIWFDFFRVETNE